MKLVPQPKTIWTKYSTLALLVLTVFPISLIMFPDIGKYIGPAWSVYLMWVVALLGLIGRFIDQSDGLSE